MKNLSTRQILIASGLVVLSGCSLFTSPPPLKNVPDLTRGDVDQANRHYQESLAMSDLSRRSPQEKEKQGKSWFGDAEDAGIRRGGAESGALPSLFHKATFLVSEQPRTLEELAASLSNVTGTAIVVEGFGPFLRHTSRIRVQGSLSHVLDVLSARYDVYWSYAKGRIVFFRTLTRTFSLAIPPGDPSLPSPGGEDFFQAFLKDLAAIVGPDGRVDGVPQSGTVTISASPRRLDEAAHAIMAENERMMRPVRLKVTVLSTTLSRQDSTTPAPADGHNKSTAKTTLVLQTYSDRAVPAGAKGFALTIIPHVISRKEVLIGVRLAGSSSRKDSFFQWKTAKDGETVVVGGLEQLRKNFNKNDAGSQARITRDQTVVLVTPLIGGRHE